MRVQQCLPYLSETTRQAILREQNQRLSVTSDQDLESRLSDTAFLATVWDGVSELERKVIHLFVYASARGFFSKKQWEQIVRLEHRHLSVGLTRLRRLGIIFTVRKLWSEVGYLMPEEVREQFTRKLVSPPRHGQAIRETLPYYIASGRGIHMDVFALLLFIRDNEVLLTQRRTIHRRFLQRMEPLVSVGEDHVEQVLGARSQEAVRQDYPSGVAMVLDLALRMQLVFPEEKRLRLHSLRVQEWMRQSPSARWSQMYRMVCEHYLPHEAWCEAFVALMDACPTDEWGSVDLLLAELRKAGFTCPADAKERIREEWLHLLLGFGWLQLGEGNDGELYWRWNGLARSDWEEGWFVDPAGVVTIPPLVPLQAIWELSKAGPLSLAGDTVVCELQARPFQAYLAHGGTEEQVLHLLQKHCAYPLPDSVKELIGHWGKSGRQIRMETLVRVRTATPRLLEELRDIPALSSFVTEVISPTDFLVPLSQEQELTEMLQRHGYEPFKGIVAEKERNEQEPPSAGDAGGLFSVKRPWDGYAVENTFPDPLESMPKLAALPKMWTQHLQAYHPQTLRDLLKRAQELQVEVQVQFSDGQQWQAVPQHVEVEMGYWYVTLEGERRRKRCRLDEIERVRIVVPDYLA
jgi:hypothetical protein